MTRTTLRRHDFPPVQWSDGTRTHEHVLIHDLDAYRPPRGTAHFHIYLVTPIHPALAKD